MILAPGAAFDRYRIEAVIGEGGMGRVYSAYDERLRRRVALKVLHVGSPASLRDSRPTTEGGARLLREARAAAALDHPNAVAIFDVGEVPMSADQPALPFIAMELIEGQSLRAFVGSADVPMEERTRWLTDVARAVAAAHKRGLVHRDIKPENVMVRDDGVVKVLDFGIARRALSGAVDPGGATETVDPMGTLTARGVVVGTPLYMAPEQMRDEPLDGRADQFSWGVVAYELLTGRLPWDREGDSLKVVSQILSKTPLPLQAVAPDVPAVVDAVVMRALAKAPTDRFASMEDIVLALDALGPRSSFRPRRLAAAEALAVAATVQSTKTSLASVGASAPVRPAVPRSPYRAGGFVVVTAVALAAGTFAMLLHRSPVAGPPKDAAATGPTAVTDLPAPPTSPEGLAAYREAMAAFRAGDMAMMSQSFKHAVDLDPHLAPALLRLAEGLLMRHPSEAREYYHRAAQLRERLTERDQGLLDALEPYVEREPSDIAETRARIAHLVERYPLDAEMVYRLGMFDVFLFSYDRALAEYKRAVALDPQFGYAMVGIGDTLGARGDFPGAIAASRECERIAPGVSNCSYVRWEIEEQEGQCEDLERDARQMIVVHPESSTGYRVSVRALSSLSVPPAALHEGIVQARSRMTESQNRSLENAFLEANFAVLQGDFVEAEALVKAYDALPAVVQSAEASVHALSAWALIELAREEQRSAVAADLAEDFRGRSLAWTPPPTHMATGLRFDQTVAMLDVLLDAGRLSLPAFTDERTKWLSRWDAQASPRGGGYWWIGGYAREASTPEQAKEALEALPRYQPLPALWEFPTDFPIGRTYFLAGRVEEAIPHLRRATRVCNAIDDPFDNTRANLFLGEALEARKDTPGACAAYKVVLDRWGHAKPRSVSADTARARSAALGCPR